MAAAGETISITLSETLTNCQICFECFDSPRMLPCQHTICRVCLLTLVSDRCVSKTQPDGVNVIKKASFRCQECRHECKVGKRGNVFDQEKILARFPENRLVKQLVEEAQKYKRKVHKNVSIQTCAEEHVEHVGVQTFAENTVELDLHRPNICTGTKTENNHYIKVINTNPDYKKNTSVLRNG